MIRGDSCRENHAVPTEGNELVSVIIPTCNRKRKLIRLIRSVRKSSYDKLEVVVVDDCSTDGTMNYVRNSFPQIKFVRNNCELETPTCRNLGARLSTGSLLFFIDDDNVVDPNTISYLVATITRYKQVGVLGPLAYYFSERNLIWCAGTKRNGVTQYSRFVGHNKSDSGNYKVCIECDEFPNAFMVRRQIFEGVGGFDSLAFPSQLSEGDFCARVKKLGYGRVLLEPRAVVWHDTPVMSAFQAFSRKKLRHSLDYQWERSRILLKKRNSSILSFIVFSVLVEPLYVLLFVALVMGSRQNFRSRFQSVSRMLKGLIDAFRMPKLSQMDAFGMHK